MKQNIFELTKEQLKAIANNLQEKIEAGLEKDGAEIKCLPTFIFPKEKVDDGRVLALDWGGTKFRAAIVEFAKGKEPVILQMAYQDLSARETAGFTQAELLEAMTAIIARLEGLEGITRIGYCFSYAIEALPDGDAKHLQWAKGIDIPEMIGTSVGKTLMEYLNAHPAIPARFTDVKVVNDTVACLFAGRSGVEKKANIGLIVGTGTNMAGLMPVGKISKLRNGGAGFIPVNRISRPDSEDAGFIPINLESGDFNPPFLTDCDRLVDKMSNNTGSHRFEKAISGGYLGELFKIVYDNYTFSDDFDGESLSRIINRPIDYPKEFVTIADWIFTRSAMLVGASLAGLIQLMLKQDASNRMICIAVEGSVFWKSSDDYREKVVGLLQELLPADVVVTLVDEEKMKEANLIGAAIAAQS